MSDNSNQIRGGATGASDEAIPQRAQKVAPMPEVTGSGIQTTSQGSNALGGTGQGKGHGPGGPGGVHEGSGEGKGLGAHKEAGTVNPNVETHNYTASIRKEHQV